MTTTASAPLAPSERLLCGPGPTNIDPLALAAMQRPILGHLDPELHDILSELVRMLRLVYQAPDGLVLPLQSTGTSGMETGIANLAESGDTVIVGASGFFGKRIAEIARRHVANVVEVSADWGEHVPNDRLVEAVEEHPEASLLAVVQGETSTGSQHPLAELADAMRDKSTLLMVDCVTTLGGNEIDIGGWGIDYAYSCTQKCIGSPPGMCPIAVSDRALERFDARSEPVPFAFDFELLRKYWIDRPAVYHHTAPVVHIYALYEVLRATLLEGLQARWARHEEAGRHLQQRIREETDLELLAEPDHQLAQLTAVQVPDGIDGKAVQKALLSDHGIEVGGGLGPSAPDMWRIGLMGPNAQTQTADRVLDALVSVLDEHRVSVGA